MKKIKWTPMLFFFPVSIGLYVLDSIQSTWTPFSFPFIVGFVLIMCLALLLDRFWVMYATIKMVWIIEILMIISVVLLLYSCT